MSRNFEEEYKEYLNAQAPDLWGRIEAGIDALPQPDLEEKEKVVPISAGQKKRAKKKKQIRYQHYRAIVSAAACLLALLVIVPVYLLVKPAGNDNAAKSAEPITLADATIINTEESVEESAQESVETTEATAEQASPAQEAMAEEMQYYAQENSSEAALQEMDDALALGGADEGIPEVECEEAALTGGGTDGKESGTSDGSIAQETETGEDIVLSETTVSVQILTEEGRQEAGMVYTAAVIGSASSETISVIVPDDSTILLEVGKAYTVTLQHFVEEGYRVVVDAVMQ